MDFYLITTPYMHGMGVVVTIYRNKCCKRTHYKTVLLVLPASSAFLRPPVFGAFRIDTFITREVSQQRGSVSTSRP